jgi:hypothetical protein
VKLQQQKVFESPKRYLFSNDQLAHAKYSVFGVVVMMSMTDQLGTPREGVMSTAASFPSVRNQGLSVQ